jgi:hypothetical protein
VSTDLVLNVEDRAELEALVVEIAWRIDHRKADTVYELFTEDGTMTLGPQAMRGRNELIEWGTARSDAGRTTRHVCTNLRFAGTGPDRAEGTVIATVFLHDGDGVGSSMPFTVGEYHDEYVRGPDGWRFSSRAMEIVFSASDP